MSELRRFFVDGDGGHEPASEYEDEHACLDGDWVRAVDVEELEQERDALKVELEEEKSWADRCNRAWDHCFNQAMMNGHRAHVLKAAAVEDKRRIATMERKIESQSIGLDQSHRDEADAGREVPHPTNRGGEFKACPWCCGIASISTYDEGEYWAYCPSCKACSGVQPSESKAIEVWNFKATERGLESQLSAAKERESVLLGDIAEVRGAKNYYRAGCVDHIKKINELKVEKAALEAKMAQVAVAMKEVRQFTCPVNAVTAPHRHGNPVPGKRMTDLCNRQIDFEETLEEIHAILSDTRPALAAVEGRYGIVEKWDQDHGTAGIGCLREFLSDDVIRQISDDERECFITDSVPAINVVLGLPGKGE